MIEFVDTGSASLFLRFEISTLPIHGHSSTFWTEIAPTAHLTLNPNTLHIGTHSLLHELRDTLDALLAAEK